MSHKKWYKRLDVTRTPGVPRILAGALRLLHASCRTTVLGWHHVRPLLESGQAGLCTTWHFAFPALVQHFHGLNVVVMVSRSRDGEMISQVLKHLGYQVERGSPGKGGAQALRTMIGHVSRGCYAGLLADGSQGPARVAQKGILLLARYTGAPLVPFSMAAHPCWRFRSWDRTVLAKPFSRIILAFDAPIWVDREISSEGLDRVRLELENSLNRLTDEAEAHLKR
jgi:lysophospholipid acyltransferase (LPLAT)-like uncharacterized protein